MVRGLFLINKFFYLVRVLNSFKNHAFLVIAYDKITRLQAFLYGSLFDRYVVNVSIGYFLQSYRKRSFSRQNSLMGYYAPCNAHGKKTVKKKNTACHQHNLSRYRIRAKRIEC